MEKNDFGFTKVELVVLIVFISVLAAVMLPQIAASAVRSQNAAALSDLQNAVLAQEALYVEYGGYGITSEGLLPGMGGTGVGTLIMGTLPAGSSTVIGGILTMGPVSGPPSRPIASIGVAVSQRVSLQSSTISRAVPLAGYGASYIMVAKHMDGDTAYAAEAEAKNAIYLCRNTGLMWVGIAGLGMLNVPAPSPGPDLSWMPACGGMEIPTWTRL